jgi:cytochrome c553
MNMKQLAAVTGALILSLGMSVVRAEEPAAAAAVPAQSVEQKASACFACHGPNGKSTNPMYPTLAGQYQDYLQNALHAYKSGARKNPIMAGMAAGLSDQDIRQLSAYFATQQGSPLYTPALQ